MKVFTLLTNYTFTEGYCPIEVEFKVYELCPNLFLFEDAEEKDYFLNESLSCIITDLEFYDYHVYAIKEEDLDIKNPLTKEILQKIEEDYMEDSLTRLARELLKKQICL